MQSAQDTDPSTGYAFVSVRPRRTRWITAILLIQHLGAAAAFVWIISQNRRLDAASGHTRFSDWQRDHEFELIGLINAVCCLSLAAAVATPVLACFGKDRRASRFLLRILWIAVMQALWLIPAGTLLVSLVSRFFPPVHIP